MVGVIIAIAAVPHVAIGATQRITFNMPDGLWEMDSTGKDRHLFFSNGLGGYRATWSADGKLVAFNGGDETDSCASTTYVTDPNGDHIRDYASMCHPEISPDGKHIVDDGGNITDVANPNHVTNPIKCDPKGGGEANSAACDPLGATWAGNDSIVFQSGWPVSGWQGALWKVPISGGALSKIDSNQWLGGMSVSRTHRLVGERVYGTSSAIAVAGGGVLAVPPDGHQYSDPRWSPDGSKIAFEDIHYDTGTNAYISHVRVMNDRGGGIVDLGVGADPSFVPDGSAPLEVTSVTTKYGSNLDKRERFGGQTWAHGGDEITIFGSGFTGATDVRFVPRDGAPSVRVPLKSSDVKDGLIFVRTPNMTAEVNEGRSSHVFHAKNTPLQTDVVVDLPHGKSSENKHKPDTLVTFEPPHVDSVEPRRGPVGGGEQLTIKGRFLTGADAVTFSPPLARKQRQVYLSLGVQEDTEIRMFAPDFRRNEKEWGIVDAHTGQLKLHQLALGVSVDVPVKGTDCGLGVIGPACELITSNADHQYTIVPLQVTGVSPRMIGVGSPTDREVRISGAGFGPRGESVRVIMSYLNAFNAPRRTDLEGAHVTRANKEIVARIPASYFADPIFTDVEAAANAQPARSLNLTANIQVEVNNVTSSRSSADRLGLVVPSVSKVVPRTVKLKGQLVTAHGHGFAGVTELQLLHPGTQCAVTGSGISVPTINVTDESLQFEVPNLGAKNGGQFDVEVAPLLRRHASVICPHEGPGGIFVWAPR